MFKKQLEKLKALKPIIDATGSDEVLILTKFLYSRLKDPSSYVVFLGETSSGKSSIINGLLGENILPVSAAPSTASITEIELTTDLEQDEYIAITKDATVQRLQGKGDFEMLAKNPTADISRLKLRKKVLETQDLKGLRIFDTPGYNSIVDEHEEVLKDFLPNCDIVVYTIGYKIGVQDEDFHFLRFLRELIRPDVEIILLINRCPENTNYDNPRIKEVLRYSTDIIGKEPTLFLADNVAPEEGALYALPEVPRLWNYINLCLSTESRLDDLRDAFDSFLDDLYLKCDAIIQSRYIAAEMSEKELIESLEAQRELALSIREAIPNLIEPTFEAIKNSLPKRFDIIVENSTEILVEDINKEKRLNKDDKVAYINMHLLPHTIKCETRDVIQDYIDVVLTDLNDQVDDLIQKETIKFNNKISIIITSNKKIAAENILLKLGSKFGTSSLNKYFMAFGGAGGANAGVANAASHLLKRGGNIFGKTFSRNTHNGLKHFLKKIGATSMKRVAGAVAILIELLAFAVDVGMWKITTRKKVKKALKMWRASTVPVVLEDLEKLKEENVKTVMQIAEEFENVFEEDDEHILSDRINYMQDVELSAKWREKYNINN